MNTATNAALGVLFLVLGLLATGLMFHYWGYPFDEKTRKSAAPQWKMNIHRGVGVAYAIVYVLLMIQMVPRLWQYQIEFPARTVAHIVLGITIGFLLVLKISILRFFRHFEEWMPVIGTALLLCTFLLLGLSLPYVYKERKLVQSAPGGSAFSAENRARVAELLPLAGMPEGVDLAALAAEQPLRDGRELLLDKCVYCHDLKTVIARPRTPADWYRTVSRMAEKPTLGDAITADETYRVTAFLVAITPDLQKSAKAKRAGELARKKSEEAAAGHPAATAEGGSEGETAPTPPVDPAAAKAMFDKTCSQCHKLADVYGTPPEDAEEIDDLVERMVYNGLEADDEDVALIKAFLNMTFVDNKE